MRACVRACVCTGSTLREVLKHKTLEQVVMVEIDEGMVEASRRYLPEWNDCSMLEGRAEVCMVRVLSSSLKKKTVSKKSTILLRRVIPPNGKGLVPFFNRDILLCGTQQLLIT